MNFDFLIVGGGAAGFFAAINIAETHPNWRIGILERGKDVLQKVRISGGGRCNVTHACFDVTKLIENYPRGKNELLQPFQVFGPAQTVAWFLKKGVRLKTEADGRMFPVTDSSQTIIDCLLSNAQKLGIIVLKGTRMEAVEKQPAGWQVRASNKIFVTKKLMLATGSDTAIWRTLEGLGVNIIPPVPSLFTFNSTDTRLQGLMGLSVPQATIIIYDTPFRASGALLITHWGLSGPAILRLSAWAATHLHKCHYTFSIEVNWLGQAIQTIAEDLRVNVTTLGKKNVLANPCFGLPLRLWRSLCIAANITEYQSWAETGKKHIQALANQLTAGKFSIVGKSTFKDEFVTAGGIALEEIDFQTFSFKKIPNLYTAGEVLNIDAITGGFNFQAAWTGGFMVANGLENQEN